MIYFVRMGRSGPIKIGYTKKASARVRIRELQVSCPRKLRTLFVMHGCKKTETLIHQRFAFAQLRGEWFYPVPELFDFIDRHRGTKFPHPKSYLRIWLWQNGAVDDYADGTMTMRDLTETFCWRITSRPAWFQRPGLKYL